MDSRVWRVASKGHARAVMRELKDHGFEVQSGDRAGTRGSLIIVRAEAKDSAHVKQLIRAVDPSAHRVN